MPLYLFLSLLLLSCDLFSAEESRISALANMPFPKKSTLLVSKDEWVSFNGDGYSVRLFNIDETSGWINLKNCEAKGFVITFFKDLKEQPLAAPEYIDLNEQICAKFQNSMGVYELLIIQRDYVFFYWSVS